MAEALRFIFGKADNSNEASIQHTVFTAATSAAMFAMGYSTVRSLPRYSVFWGIVATAFAARANQVNCDEMNMFFDAKFRERDATYRRPCANYFEPQESMAFRY